MPPHERHRDLQRGNSSSSDDDDDTATVTTTTHASLEKQQQHPSHSATSNGRSDHEQPQQQQHIRFHSSPTEAPFVECTSPHGFTNPYDLYDADGDDDNDGDAATTKRKSRRRRCRTPAEVNQEDLNLFLGQRWVTSNHSSERLDAVTAFHHRCIDWWETPLLLWLRRYILVDSILRFVLITVGWNRVYKPLHVWLFQRRTGLHPSVSLECHALSTVMYLGHFVLHSIQRIRFGLSLLAAARPQPPVHRVQVLPDHRGLFVHHHHRLSATENDTSSDTTHATTHTTTSTTSTTTLIWFHAGAYLSGCPRGNVGVADAICCQSGCNVFLPQYRLAPEHSMAEIMEDVMAAYAWIRHERPNDTLLVGGWSAGAALAMRLLQQVSSSSSTSPIAAAILCSPFCRYALPDPDSTMIHYAQQDWLVTQGVSRVSFDTLQPDTFWGGDDPQVHSPLDARNLRQLRHVHSAATKILVVVSEHEAVYDETCELIRSVRAHTTIPVTVAQWRYMPHGWYMFDSLMPEGARAVQYMCDWMKTNVTMMDDNGKKCD